MKNLKRRSLCRYGLAILVIAGAGLLTATGPSGASDGQGKADHDCWVATSRICNLNYYPQCWEQPDGTTCFKCPYTVIASANCVSRPTFTCDASSEIPLHCGPKLGGVCVGGMCYGSVPSTDFCTIVQCSDTPL